MKHGFFLLVLALALAGCGHPNPIDRIVKEESANGTFPSGIFTPIYLPATASIREVTSNVLARATAPSTVTNITILQVQHVTIDFENMSKELLPFGPTYTAVLVNTTLGQKVVLLQYEGSSTNSPSYWWNRVYNVQP